jgi:neutral amino acid transport system substrate-binding protein
MSRRTVTVCFFSLCLAGCKPEEKLPPIVIGAVVPSTGNLASYGPVLSQAAQLAVEQVNAAGGVLSRDLQLKLIDDGSDPVRSAEAIRTLKAEGAVAVVGMVASSSALSACPVATELQIPLVVSTAATPAYGQLHAQNPYCFRTRANSLHEAKLVAKRLKELGKTKVGLMNIDNGYGNGFNAAFTPAYAESAGAQLVKKVVYKAGASNYEADLNAMYAENPDAIVLAGYPPDGAQIIKDHIRLGSRPLLWYFTVPLMDTSFVSLTGGNNFGFQHEGVGPPSPATPEFQTFYDAYTAAYGKGDAQYYGYGAHMFDAVYVAALSIAAASSVDGPVIQPKVIPTTRGGRKVGPQNFKEAAASAANEDLDFEGAGGNVDMDDNGDIVGGFDLWQVKNNEVSIQQRAVTP